MHRSVLLCLAPVLGAALGLHGAALRAQGGIGEPAAPKTTEADASQQSPKPVAERIDDAIDAYEKALKDKDNHALRRRTLGWLGEIDDARVDDYLVKDLKRHIKWESGGWAIDAIAKVDRPQLQGALIDALFDGNAHGSVRRGAAELLVNDDDAVERVFEKLRSDKYARVQTNVLRALASVGGDEVADGIADMMEQGEHEQRLAIVLATAAARGADKIDRARIRCVKEGNLILSATAWRILAEQGHSRANRLTVDVLERVYDKPDPQSAAELVRGLVAVDDKDFYPAILRFGSVRGGNVKAALKASAKRAAESGDLMDFLIEEGLESDSAADIMVAKTLLTEAPPTVVGPLVERVRKQLRRNRKKVLETAAGLHELLSKDPGWVRDLAELAGERDLESRLIGLSLLLEMGSPIAVPAAQDYCDHRAWELRSLSFRYLAKCRDVTSIPALIERYEREEGRLKHELETALFVHTGTRCWTRSAWKSWWREHKVGFTLPHEKTVAAGGTTSGGNTVSYYDIPLVSNRIAFVIDHSGSMQAAIGTDKKRTRLDEAKRQLTMVAKALPNDHQVNLIPFGSQVRTLWDEIEKLSGSRRDEFLKAVSEIKPGGGTNTYGALIRAYHDPDVDTVYLLTDGQPSAGELVDIDDILDAIARENRMRQIVIHCIAVGLDSRLLKELAAMTGGEYKYVR